MNKSLGLLLLILILAIFFAPKREKFSFFGPRGYQYPWNDLPWYYYMNVGQADVSCDGGYCYASPLAWPKPPPY